MSDQNNDYWAMRNVELQLQSAVRERNALKSQVEFLQQRLKDTLAKLDLSYARYHEISIAHADVLDRALDHSPSSKVVNLTVDNRSLLLLKNPVVPARKRGREILPELND